MIEQEYLSKEGEVVSGRTVLRSRNAELVCQCLCPGGLRRQLTARLSGNSGAGAVREERERPTEM